MGLDGEKGLYGILVFGGGVGPRQVPLKPLSLITDSLYSTALEEGTPITDPTFYASEESCPDALIAHVFRAAPQSVESIPLLPERIKVMRETGFILTSVRRPHAYSWNGMMTGSCRRLVARSKASSTSFKGAIMVKGRHLISSRWSLKHSLASKMKRIMRVERVGTQRASLLPGYSRSTVYLWKRAQILVAEIWAAFYPPSKAEPHPIFPGTKGPQISHLTMFADYRVPQILHHLQIIDYPSSLLEKLRQKVPFPPGSREEISLRTASIVAVERVREAILQIIKEEGGNDQARDASEAGTISSVLIDFYLWDLAKKLENGEDKIEGIETTEVVPIHRTRSIWY